MNSRVSQPDDTPGGNGQKVYRRDFLLSFATLAAATAADPTFAQSPTCSDVQSGGIWWNELISADPVQARAFYTKVMGWTAKVVSVEDNARPPALGEEEYTLFLQDGREVAGLTKIDAAASNPRPGWLAYMQVGSVEDAVTETLKTGGKVIRFPVDLVKVGRIAVVEDLSGAQIGVVTPAISTPG